MFRVIYSGRASKSLENIPRKWRERILTAADTLSEFPFKGKKLRGSHEGLYSLRVWPYRIIYKIYNEMITVVIVDIGHRQRIYG